jgi:hypothetical protein
MSQRRERVPSDPNPVPRVTRDRENREPHRRALRYKTASQTCSGGLSSSQEATHQAGSHSRRQVRAVEEPHAA